MMKITSGLVHPSRIRKKKCEIYHDFPGRLPNLHISFQVIEIEPSSRLREVDIKPATPF